MKINYEIKDGKEYGVITYNNTIEYEKAAIVIESIEDHGYWIDVTEFGDTSEARIKISDKEEYNKIKHLYDTGKDTYYREKVY